jgi:hypothetical protein
MLLNDKEIRSALIEYLNNKAKKPRRIIEELPVHRGNAIADVVTVHGEAHCYEIKGEKDNINRLKVQGEFYNKSFNRITLVTTEKKLDEALIKAPVFWGILIAFYQGELIKFKYLRKAKINSMYDKELALTTLWRGELTQIDINNQLEINKKVDKRVLAQKISEKMNKAQTNKSIADLLAERVFNNY